MRAFITALSAGLTAGAALNEADIKFAQYAAKYAKEYKSMEEYQLRKDRFFFIDAEIDRLNNSQSDSVHGHNRMSDWTTEEVSAMLLENVEAPDTSKLKAHKPYQPDNSAATQTTTPTWWSWCYYGMCSPVKDMLQYGYGYDWRNCKSSYAWVSVQAIEANYRIRKGLDINLSEQQIIDCTIDYGNSGCAGGNYWNAFDYAQVYPIYEGPNVYPFTGLTGTCKYDPNWFVGKAQYYGDYYSIMPTSPQPNRDAMWANKSAMAACVCNDTAFQTYSSGVLTNGGSCCNLAVTVYGWGFSGNVEWLSSRYNYLNYNQPSCSSIYGYGYACKQTDLNDYRITPNWGTDWGENGFGSISFYPQRDPLKAASVLYAAVMIP